MIGTVTESEILGTWTFSSEIGSVTSMVLAAHNVVTFIDEGGAPDTGVWGIRNDILMISGVDAYSTLSAELHEDSAGVFITMWGMVGVKTA